MYTHACLDTMDYGWTMVYFILHEFGITGCGAVDAEHFKAPHPDCDGTIAGSLCTRAVGDPRAEARTVDLFIYLHVQRHPQRSWLLRPE